MNDMHNQCPQCLLSNCIDCHEPDCPGEAGMVPKKERGAAVMDSASMKILTTMGLRICLLEKLIVRAGNYFAGHESGGTGVKSDIMREAGRILGKKKEGGFDDLWRVLAGQWHCNTIGGMEYRRVLFEWQRYEGRDSMETFIKRQVTVPKKEGGAV